MRERNYNDNNNLAKKERVSRQAKWFLSLQRRQRGQEGTWRKEKDRWIGIGRGNKSDRRGALPTRLWPLSRYTFLRFPTAGGGPCFPFSPHRDTDKVTHGRKVNRSVARVLKLSLIALSGDQVENCLSLVSSWTDCDNKKRKRLITYSTPLFFFIYKGRKLDLFFWIYYYFFLNVYSTYRF